MDQLELCLGSIQEMTEGSIYAVVDRYAQAAWIAYIHFRHVRGKVPGHLETILDEGDIDMPWVSRIRHAHGYEGVLIPDYTPEMTCGAPWHAGMACALDYMRALLQTAERS